nr:hypothetical protein [Tanacetum cinerariifolium]
HQVRHVGHRRNGDGAGGWLGRAQVLVVDGGVGEVGTAAPVFIRLEVDGGAVVGGRDVAGAGQLLSDRVDQLGVVGDRGIAAKGDDDAAVRAIAQLVADAQVGGAFVATLVVLGNDQVFCLNASQGDLRAAQGVAVDV